mmetsp:Transcript_16430/g.24846  ORF Transcript_16430/g.24846 Transcript_16430/m.24846 type:complete len:110 (-) Transcript_16430:2550-2879(-)
MFLQTKQSFKLKKQELKNTEGTDMSGMHLSNNVAVTINDKEKTSASSEIPNSNIGIIQGKLGFIATPPNSFIKHFPCKSVWIASFAFWTCDPIFKMLVLKILNHLLHFT